MNQHTPKNPSLTRLVDWAVRDLGVDRRDAWAIIDDATAAASALKGGEHTYPTFSGLEQRLTSILGRHPTDIETALWSVAFEALTL